MNIQKVVANSFSTLNTHYRHHIHFDGRGKFRMAKQGSLKVKVEVES